MNNKLLIKALLKANRIAIFAHQNPDGDALGCMSTLYYALKQRKKEVDMFCDSIVPERYAFLGTLGDINKKEFDAKNYDLLVAVDCAELKRIGVYAETYRNFGNTINIDHHKTNDNYGKFNYVKSTYKSCGEVLFEVLDEAKMKYTNQMATTLYASIASDTGRFNYAGVDEYTFYKASKLMSYGADLPLVHKWLFNYRTKEQLALGQVLLKNIKIVDKYVITFVTQENYTQTNSKRSDVELFYPWVSNIAGTEAAVIIKESSENEYHISFRGNGNIDVGNVALKFGGGGHKDAAGCTILGTMKEVKQKLIDALNEEFNNAK